MDNDAKNLPALRILAVPIPASAEAFNRIADLTSKDVARGLARLDERVRVLVGAWLYARRQEHDGGSGWEIQLGEWAAQFDRSTRTLRRWMEAGREHFDLPALAESSVEDIESDLTRDTMSETVDNMSSGGLVVESGREADDTLPAEITKPPTVDDESSSEVEAGTSPRADGSATPRGAQPPSPGQLRPHINALLVAAADPDTVPHLAGAIPNDDVERLVTLFRDVRYIQSEQKIRARKLARLH